MSTFALEETEEDKPFTVHQTNIDGSRLIEEAKRRFPEEFARIGVLLVTIAEVFVPANFHDSLPAVREYGVVEFIWSESDDGEVSIQLSS